MENQHETEEERIARLKRWGEIPLDKEATMRHFGYDPQIYRGMQCGLWESNKVYEEIPGLEGFQKIHGRKKVRVILDYDPDFPKAMFRVEQIPSDEGR